MLAGLELDVHWLTPVGAMTAALVVGRSLVAVYRARRAGRAVEHQLETIDRELPDMLFATEQCGRLLSVSRASARLLGYEPERMVGRLLHEFVSDPIPHIDRKPDASGPWTARWRLADGSYAALTASVTRHVDEHGAPAGVRGVLRDEIDRARTEQALRRSEERFRTALDAAQNGIMLVTHDGRLLLANAALSDLLGYEAEEMKQLVLADVLPPAHLDQLMALIASRLWSDAAPGQYEVRLRARDGRMVDVEITVSALREPGEDSGALIEVRDLTEARRASETIRRITDYDRLTGLPNRELFDRHVERALIDARATGRSVGLLMVDLDRFKLINDTLGHLSGDRLLKAVAQRLGSQLTPAQLLARFSADEFLVLAPDLPSTASVETFAGRLLDGFSSPFEHDGHELQIAASAGVAVFPDDGDDAETLIRIADAAVHLAKADGGNQFRLGSCDAAEPARKRLALEGDLRRAVERGEFEVYYQPQLDIRRMSIRGVEALLRWRHPQRGIVSPSEFIPLLEETGLIVDVGEWVLRTACRQVQEWRASGDLDVYLAVNLAPRQLLVPNFHRTVEAILAETGLPAEALELELTETMASLGMDSMPEALRELSTIGVATAIDDFGIGHSWLGRLKRFPVRTLKIDRSFVTGADKSPNDLAIIKAIVALGHALELSIVAEGVETHAELEMLRSIGCDLVQGFYFAPAIEAGAMRQMLEDFHSTAWAARAA